MSTKLVQIEQAGDFRQAQPPQVFVAEGEQIEFVNAGSDGTLLVLTPETAAILSPTPSSPVAIAGGATVTYTFLAPTGSGYLAQVLPEDATPGPVQGQGAEGPVLTILPSTDRDPGNRTGRAM
jgi:hypothetical protein